MLDGEFVSAIREIVGRHCRIRHPEIEDRHTLARDLGYDSLSYLLTLSDLEARFKFHYPLEKVDQLRDISFRDLVRLVAEGRAGALVGETDG
jgi:acyl carrier protein